jgi:hypothetical protein
MSVTGERSADAFACLPPAVVLHVLSLLPVDARARAAAVCRGWRDALAERSMWTRLDLSPTSGVARGRVTDAFLAAVSARAAGHVEALNITSCERITRPALLAVVNANAGTLCELRAWHRGHERPLSRLEVEQMLQAAPRLQLWQVECVDCASFADAHRVLGNQPPFGPLQARCCKVSCSNDDATEHTEAAVRAVAADIVTHASLQELIWWNGAGWHIPALDAVVDAALARRLTALRMFTGGTVSPAAAVALARLLDGGALTELLVANSRTFWVDEPAAAVLGAALRRNTTLTSLSVLGSCLFDDAAAATLLLDALTAHPTVRVLHVGGNWVHNAAAAAGRALGALLAANAPALLELGMDSCNLGDAGLRPVMDALPRNTHLRKLDCAGNNMTLAFARSQLLRAVRDHASLRSLHCTFAPDEEEDDDEDEMQALLRHIEATVER